MRGHLLQIRTPQQGRGDTITPWYRARTRFLEEKTHTHGKTLNTVSTTINSKRYSNRSLCHCRLFAVKLGIVLMCFWLLCNCSYNMFVHICIRTCVQEEANQVTIHRLICRWFGLFHARTGEVKCPAAPQFYPLHSRYMISGHRAQLLEVSLLGVGTVLRLERGAWSIVK